MKIPSAFLIVFYSYESARPEELIQAKRSNLSVTKAGIPQQAARRHTRNLPSIFRSWASQQAVFRILMAIYFQSTLAKI